MAPIQSSSNSPEITSASIEAADTRKVPREDDAPSSGRAGASSPPLAPDRAAMLAFGSALALPLYCASIIHADTGQIRTRSCAADGLPELVEALADANDQGWNVYFQPNPPRRFFNGSERPSKADVCFQAFAHVDVDPARGANRETERERIFNASPEGIPPATVIIDSGNGAQRLWKLREVFPLAPDDSPAEKKLKAAELAESVNRGLAERFDADMSATDVSRLLRWAGSVNHPSKAKRDRGYVARLSRLIEHRPERVYSRDELPRSAPAEVAKPAASGSEVPQCEPVFSESLSQWLPPATEALARAGDVDDRIGRPGDRSDDVFHFACECVRREMPAAVLLGVLLDPRWKISSHVLDHKASTKYALRQIAMATKEVAKENRPPAPEGAIVLADGRLNENLQAAEAALRAAGVPFYERGGEIVRPVRLERSEETGGVRRDAGATIVVPVSDRYCVQRLADSARFGRTNSQGEWTPADPPLEFARHLLDRQGEWSFPALRGVVNAPTMRRDGSILQQPGFDAVSGYIFDPRGVAFPSVADSPSRQEAEAALASIEALYSRFPFDSEPSRAVALSSVLTAVARTALRTAPMHCFDSPTPGTGKTILAEVPAMIATGALPAMMSQGASEEELEKRLSSAMRCGDRVIVIDNVERPLSGDCLCSMLTQERVQARILGKSERVILETDALFIATGNNLRFAGDLSRRAVKCRIDSGIERPDQRAFDFDPRELARTNRPALVAAALTMLRAYIFAGKPVKLPAFGSFDDYCLIRETLVWLGRSDPAETRAAIFAADTKRDELGELLAAWRDVFGGSAITLAEAKVRLESSQELAGGVLYGALIDVGARGDFNARSIGRKLAAFIDRPASGLVFRRSENRLGIRWRVEQVGRPEPAEPPAVPDYGEHAGVGL